MITGVQTLERKVMVNSQSNTKTIQLLLLLLCAFVVCFQDLAHAEPPYKYCPSTGNYAVNSSLENNLNNLFHSLSSAASIYKFNSTSTINGTERVYGMYMCLNYTTNERCHACIMTASQDIKRLCPNTTEATVWEEECQLRYSNKNFAGNLNVTGNLALDNDMNYKNPDLLNSIVKRTLSDLTKQAADGNMYAVKQVDVQDDELSALVQCTADLSPEDCNTCLQKAITDVESNCSSSRGARLLSFNCYLRYELYAFYEGATNSSAPHERGKGSVKKIWMIIILTVVSAILVVTLLAFIIYCFAMRKGIQRGKKETIRKQFQLYNIGSTEESDFKNQHFQGREDLKAHEFYIDLETIRAATGNFSDSNMLGQGGFGPVYKGIFSDGKKVAVKRLLSSEQGNAEFTNEVLLILKLQHKNLVKLLGFCVDQEEKLLVYEFMPNNSLDVILFDSKNHAELDWSRRINIINGIARGILYLHEDSRLRIIHRDLKASNVLLDCEMNPKISDFGMARIFAGSEGEASTARIVGTYGYMAPEYAMEGLYSIKSDVYSFGVVLIEIITGRRNAGFHHSKRAPRLLAYAWQLWNEGTALELMDPLLIDTCFPEEFLRYIHIGLLCVQEDAFERPTMSFVVVMLKGETATLRPPKRPPFSVGRFTDHYEENANNFSVNGLTISNIAPR